MSSNVLKKIISRLEKDGLLLEFDSKLPSVVSFIIDEPIKGSWWGHPLGNLVFNVTCELEDHKDVIKIKLIANKITYIHRKLWPALVSVVTARESWQIKNLSEASRQLLEEIRKKGIIRMDKLLKPGTRKLSVSQKKAAVELEKRLLVVVTSVHTETGAHFKQLEDWGHWIKTNKLSSKVSEAKTIIEQAACRSLNTSEVKLPWR